MKNRFFKRGAYGVAFSCGLVLAAMASAPVMAQTAASTSSIPRNPGVLTAGKLDSITYTPNCTKKFVFDVDAAAIQESTNRAFLLAQEAKFNGLRQRWNEYEDCMVENAKLDVKELNDKLSAYIQASADLEEKSYIATSQAANEASARIAANKKKVAPKGFTPIAWTEIEPTARAMGTVTAGPISSITYASGCGVYTGEVTVEDFKNVTSPEDFNKMVDVLKVGPAKIQKAIDCRNKNVQEDFTIISKKIQDDLNAAYLPEKTKFETQYAKVRNQFNMQRQAGGALYGVGSKSKQK